MKLLFKFLFPQPEQETDNSTSSGEGPVQEEETDNSAISGDYESPSPPSSPPPSPPRENYFSVLESLSKKWLSAQLTHHVSAAGANTFWDIAMDAIPKMVSIKDVEGVTRKTPRFTQERRKMYKDNCPKIQMRFAFKHKLTGEIETIDCDATPAKRFQRNPDYVKIYEEAHVKVIIRFKLGQYFPRPLIIPMLHYASLLIAP